jgi:hypothetical protein
MVIVTVTVETRRKTAKKALRQHQRQRQRLLLLQNAEVHGSVVWVLGIVLHLLQL